MNYGLFRGGFEVFFTQSCSGVLGMGTEEVNLHFAITELFIKLVMGVLGNTNAHKIKQENLWNFLLVLHADLCVPAIYGYAFLVLLLH